MATDSLSALLTKANLLFEIAIDNYTLVKEAFETETDTVNIESKNNDGTSVTLTLPSVSFLEKRISSLQSQFDNLVQFSDGATSYAELVDVTGRIRAIYSVSYDKSPTRITGTSEVIDHTASRINSAENPLEESYYPYVEAKIDLTGKVKINSNSVMLRRYRLTTADWETITTLIEAGTLDLTTVSTMSLEALLLSSGITPTIIEKRYATAATQIRYWGDFDTLTVSVDSSNSSNIAVKLNLIKYSDRQATVQYSKELTTDDRIVSADGSTVFEILSINSSTNVVSLKRIVGSGDITVSNASLKFLDQSQEKTLWVPAAWQERAICFVQAIDSWWETTSEWSEPFLFDTSEIRVIDGTNASRSIDEWMTLNASVDVASFLQRLASESSPKATATAIPPSPTLTETLFEVGVVNEHIVNNTESKQVKSLVAKKKSSKAELDKANRELKAVRELLDTGNYKNIEEQRTLETKASKLSRISQEKLTEFRSTVQTLAENDAVKAASKTYTPKFKET